MGGNYIKLLDGRTDNWNTIMYPIQEYINFHGAGNYRFGVWARVDNASQAHIGNLGYRFDGWPVFPTINTWEVHIGTDWTEIKTPDEGVWIDPATGNGAVLVYMTVLIDGDGNAIFGDDGVYTGEVYLDGFYFEFVGQ
jgi:hypothetical protein